MTSRRATTLIELLVVLSVMGIVAAVVALALPEREQPPSGRGALVGRATRLAIRTGRVVTLDTSIAGAAASLTAFPDGSVVADTAFHVDDPLTGEVRREPR